jgi:hypothetical protein
MAKKLKKNEKKNNQINLHLILDLRTIVILTFTLVWAIITLVDMFNSQYNIPESLNLILGGIVAYLTASKIKEGIK